MSIEEKQLRQLTNEVGMEERKQWITFFNHETGIRKEDMMNMTGNNIPDNIYGKQRGKENAEF